MLISKDMMYKANFIIRFLTLSTLDLLMPLVTILIYNNTAGFRGWNLEEILLFQSLVIFTRGLDRLLFWRIGWEVGSLVREGTLDRMLLLPVNTVYYLMVTSMGFEQLPEILIAIALFIYAAIKLHLLISFTIVIELIAYLLLAVLFLYSMMLIRIAIIAVNVKATRIGELLRVIKSFGEYPTDIFSQYLRIIFDYVFPLSLIAFYPASILLNRARGNFVLISLSVISIWLVGEYVWRKALNSYSSAGG
jgi:ABC-2 type transport system permease protein